MKRFAAILLVVTISAVSCLRSGREYEYSYRTQALAGMPGTSQDFTGLSLSARVSLKVNDKVIMKFSAVRLFYTNSALERVPRYDVIDDELRPLPEQFTSALVPQLEKPVEFSLREGVVSDLKTIVADPEWSVNVKRGFASLLQIRTRPGETSGHAYNNVTEETILGRCTALYTYSSQPVAPSPGVPSQVLNVSKVVDWASCQNAPRVYKSNFRTLACEDCSHAKEPVQSSTHVKYNLIGDHDRYDVEEVKVTESHVFAPYKEVEEGHAATYVHQVARLVRSSALSGPRPLTEPLVTRPLVMVLPEISHQLAAERREGLDAPAQMEKVYEIVEKLAESPVNAPEETPYLLLCLVKMLQLAGNGDLRLISQRYFTSAEVENDKIRTLLIDVLPMLGTDPALAELSRLVESGHVTSDRLTRVFSTLPLTFTPSHEVISKVKELCNKPSVTGEPRKICLLAWSAMINKYLAKKTWEKTSDRDAVQQSTENKYWPELVSMWSSASSLDDRILALKVIGNSGLARSLPLLESVIRPRDVTTRMSDVIRYQAVLSMKNIALFEPTKVEKALLPVFLNVTESTEIRVITFLMIMETLPATRTLNLIAEQVPVEKNLHVASYVYSFLASLSVSNAPDLRTYSRRVQTVLSRLPVIKPGIQYPKHVHIPVFYERLNFGTVLDLCSIPNEKNFLPKAARFNVKAHVLGNAFNVLEAGYYLAGIQTLLEKLVGPHGSVFSGKSVFDVIKPRSDVIEPRSDVITARTRTSRREAIRRFRAEEPRVSPREAEIPQGFLYMNMFDRAMRVTTFDKQAFHEYLSDKRVTVTDLVSKLRRGLDLDLETTLPLEDGLLTLPSMSGLPVHLDLTALAHVYVRKGLLKAEVLPSAFSEERRHQAPTEVKVKLEMAPRLVVGLSAGFGLVLDTLKFQTSVQGSVIINLPVRAELAWKLREGRVEMNVPVIHKEEKLVSMELKPMNRVLFINLAEPFTRSEYEESAVMVHMGEEKEMVSPPCEYLSEHLGLDSSMKISYTRKPYDEPSLVTQFNLNLVLKPTHNTADVITVAMETRRSPPGLGEKLDVEGVSEDAREEGASAPEAEQESRGIIDSIADLLNWNSDEEVEGDREVEEEGSGLVSEEVFIPLPELLPISKPEFRKVVMKVHVIRNRTPRSVRTYAGLLEVKTDADDRKYNVQAQWVSGGEPRVAERMCVNGYIKYPETAFMTYEPSSAPEARQIQAEVKLSMGRECTERQAVSKMTLLAEKSRDQLIWEQAEGYKQMPEFNQCRTDRQAGIKYSPACLHMGDLFNQLYKYTVRVRYDNRKLPAVVREYAPEILDYLRYLLPDLTPEPRTAPSLPGRMEVQIEMLPPMSLTPEREWPVQPRGLEQTGVSVANTWFWNLWTSPAGNQYTLMNLTVSTPGMSEGLRGARLPLPLIPLNLDPPYSRNLAHLLTTGRLPAWCWIGEKRLVSFDKVEIHQAIQPGCEVVVAEDCSPEHRFKVIMKPVGEGPNKMLKLLVEGREVELIPGIPEWEVKVDGQRVKVTVTRPLIIRKTADTISSSYEKKEPITLAVVKEEGGEWVVAAPLSLMKVRFNGKESKVHISPFYYGKTCGVCGPFNGQVYKQLITREKRPVATPRELFLNYYQTTATCRPAPELVNLSQYPGCLLSGRRVLSAPVYVPPGAVPASSMHACIQLCMDSRWCDAATYISGVCTPQVTGQLARDPSSQAWTKAPCQ